MAQDWRQGGGRIVFVGHQEGIKGALTVRENLKFWSALMGTGDPETALNTMGLRQLQDRFARNLSAGQRRRLALARLLLGSWDLWLLDEPFTALDDWARTILLQSIREHLASGGMAIIAGHDNLDLPGSSAMLEEVVA